MRSLSDLTNEQLMELIEEIKKKNGGETDAKNWSHEDIERLLELTDRGKQLEELDRERDGVPEEQSASNEEFCVFCRSRFSPVQRSAYYPCVFRQRPGRKHRRCGFP